MHVSSVYKNTSLYKTVSSTVSCIGLGQIFPFVVGWVRLGQSADGLGWIGSHKMDSERTPHVVEGTYAYDE